MVRFLESLIGGLTLGGTFALISLGLVLVFRATRVFNFAHGELLLLPAFLLGWFELRHMGFVLALIISIAVPTVVALIFYYVVLRRTAGLSLFMGIIATLGLASILDGVMGIWFPTEPYQVTFSGVPTGNVTIFGASFSAASLVFFGLTTVIAVAVICVVRFTHLGLRIRAVGQDAILSSQCGLQVQWLHAGSWAFAGVLAAIAGISYSSVSSASTSMVDLGLSALPAVMLGGLDSIEGAVIGGFAIGLLQSFAQTYLGADYVNVLTYVLLLLVMLLYPQGLFGSKEAVRA